MIQTNNKQIQFKNYLQYAQAVTRTLEREGEKSDVGHMGLGMLTEFLELRKAVRNNDLVNVVEEIGDLNWYCANHLQLYFNEKDPIWSELTKIYFLPQSSLLSIDDQMLYIEIKLERYADVCKKLFAYGQYVTDYYEEIKDLNLAIHQAAAAILLTLNIIPHEALNKNITKLYKRYPVKFDSFLAMNRDLVQEFEVLSKDL
jgi:hypothetical protein